MTAERPGPWHFGFLLANGFSEQLIAGNEVMALAATRAGRCKSQLSVEGRVHLTEQEWHTAIESP
ncbi:hypothetical protein BST27_01395 [Mycobacterium intermedium]|uniref:Uncharacterized protein n=1 Tax=Mycobacterium intermedium TaxID=28445 RepID=A0A1E3SG49_MYCIE|nr:hypothetical protein [Mycobacterium intermedium]MCV6963756.1 hypothetical protein [Mycobacterium intermedium]ODR01111.1 hypothetical protein BHQ20_10560 [Mycobacterium intermedium]OPE49286.1 hypothetical protein BV508_14555 [Mycobacterium intermedium]ORB10525.1 hypothetical protein BST27_01395 [Mycobacterium intermedium]